MHIILNKPVSISMDSLKDILTETNNAGRSLTEPLPELGALNALETDSEGLIVLTDEKNILDSESENEQEYEITIDDYLSKDAKNMLKKGIVMEGNFVKGIELKEEKHKGNRSVVIACMTENTAHHIRGFFKLIGYHVTAVRCVRVGDFKLGVLSIGKWKTV